MSVKMVLQSSKCHRSEVFLLRYHIFHTLVFEAHQAPSRTRAAFHYAMVKLSDWNQRDDLDDHASERPLIGRNNTKYRRWRHLLVAPINANRSLPRWP